MRQSLAKFTSLFIALILASSPTLHPDPTPGAPATGESVLLIYTDVTAYNVDLKDAFRTALLNIVPPATITELVINSGDGLGAGFYDELVAQTGQTNLSSWCQVYDLRFRDDQNNVGWTGQDQEDVITYIGTNTDYDLYTDYLNNGGKLFLQGEHTDYYIRNTNLMMFINSVAVSPITATFPSINSGAYSINEYMSSPENFSTDFNDLSALGSISGNYVGWIPTAEQGSGRPLTEVNSGAGAMALGYLPSDLIVSMGRLVVSFETNGFAETGLQNAASEAWIQNIYDFLSGCYRYNITKTFTPDNGCVGDTGVFTLCYSNTGGSDLTNITIYDTVPTCLTVTGSTPAADGNSGNIYWWNIGTIPMAGSGCITVDFDITAFPPCP